MEFILKITYKDEKVVEVKLREEDAQNFFDCINSSKVWWSTLTGHGFWTNILEIRHIHIRPCEENLGFSGKAALPFEA